MIDGLKSDESRLAASVTSSCAATSTNTAVMELLGSKTTLAAAEDQLSGLGFSTTVRNEVVLRVGREHHAPSRSRFERSSRSNIFEETSRFKLRVRHAERRPHSGRLVVVAAHQQHRQGEHRRHHARCLRAFRQPRLRFRSSSRQPSTPLVRSNSFGSISLNIIEVKKAENSAALAARERAETKARIRELIANKQDEALAGKSVDNGGAARHPLGRATHVKQYSFIQRRRHATTL